MKNLKKFIPVFVECMVREDDSSLFVLRAPNGSAVSVVDTPADLQSFFFELLKADASEEQV